MYPSNDNSDAGLRDFWLFHVGKVGYIAFPTLILVENIVSVFYEGIFLDVTFPLLISVKNIVPIQCNSASKIKTKS